MSKFPHLVRTKVGPRVISRLGVLNWLRYKGRKSWGESHYTALDRTVNTYKTTFGEFSIYVLEDKIIEILNKIVKQS